MRDGGCYGMVDGPRFNTRAEIRGLAACGVTAVSQTAGPETVLCGELELPYALLGFATDYANGVMDEATPVSTLVEMMARSTDAFSAVLERGAAEDLRALTGGRRLPLRRRRRVGRFELAQQVHERVELVGLERLRQLLLVRLDRPPERFDPVLCRFLDVQLVPAPVSAVRPPFDQPLRFEFVDELQDAARRDAEPAGHGLLTASRRLRDPAQHRELSERQIELGEPVREPRRHPRPRRPPATAPRCSEKVSSYRFAYLTERELFSL